MITDEYAAGFFDADGCISISPPRRTSVYVLLVSISQVDANVLFAFKEAYGGKVVGPKTRGDNRRPIFQWVAESKVAEALLERIAPHLIVKRERALLALEFRQLFKGEHILPRGRSVDRFPEKKERILRSRQVCYERMRQLNKRGVR